VINQIPKKLSEVGEIIRALKQPAGLKTTYRQELEFPLFKEQKYKLVLSLVLNSF
jgi:hypothetical protein